MNAAQPRATRARVDGVLLLDKPQGLSSQAAVTRVKAAFGASKAGHTGTLDPAATGLLPVALGEATKFSSSLLDASKTYLATVRLGQTTTTGDLEGEVTGTAPVDADLPRIEAVLSRFEGEIEQTPPMYSALKHAGKPLYEYARAGAAVVRQPRRVTISTLTLLEHAGSELRLLVSCSKGTYIRVLAEDIGTALGCGACLAALRRTRVAHLDVAGATTLHALDGLSRPELRERLLPVDAMLVELPALELDRQNAHRILSGMRIDCDATVRAGLLRVYGPGRIFLGVAEAAEPGRIQPRRLVAGPAANLE